MNLPSHMTEVLRYQRQRFSMELPVAYRYSSTHFWLAGIGDGAWRVGLTKFGTRMLGEMVEISFNVEPGTAVGSGQVLGWVEGFKAISDLCCLVEGKFIGQNPGLASDIAMVNRDPHGEGWLYVVNGQPNIGCVPAAGYIKFLDESIDELSDAMGGACGS